MSKIIIKYITTLTVIAGLIVPAPALAAVNTSPTSAADGLRYLKNNQNADGSISGFGGESEWSAEAVAASGQDVASFAHGGSSLLDFLKSDTPGSGTSTTALERKIIAIAAAGQDPSSFGGVDYMALLSAKHTGGQIGDTALLNDDIFGIIAIDAAHDASLAPEAQDALDYLLAHQGTDGGFSWSTASCAYCGSDSSDTAAAIIALYAASDLGLSPSNLDSPKSDALAYLLTTQQGDGGFGADAASPSDGSSTAWSLMALNMVGSSVNASAASARAWLLDDQNTDGGFSYGAYGTTASDTYTTAGAVVALLGTTWLLNPAPTPIAVRPPQPPTSPIGSGGGSGNSGSGSSGGSTQTVTSSPGSGSNGTQTTVAASEPASTTSDQGASATADNSSKTDESGQVKGASTSAAVKPGKKSTSKAGHKAAAYGAALLILVAFIWFMLESRKGHGARQ